MKRVAIKKVSAKQEIELAKRRLLKWELFNEQAAKCKNCGRFLFWDDNNKTLPDYPHLSHKKPLSQGGKTDRENCEVLCAECHSNSEHGLNNKYNEQPSWTKP